MNETRKWTWGTRDIYKFHPVMNQVYGVLQENGYALTDIPLEQAAPEMKEKIFTFCIDMMR